MIPYVDVQLSVWGKWIIRHASKAHGYPSMSPMFREFTGAAAQVSRLPFGIEEYTGDTDKAVGRLSEQQRIFAVNVYVIGGKDVAKRIGLSSTTYYRRLDQLHHEMLGHMNDIAAGL